MTLSSNDQEIASSLIESGLELNTNIYDGKVTGLEIHSRELTQLPLKICQLSHLQNLALDRCQLTRLPPAISQLSHLRRLSLNHNPIAQLPPEIGQLLKLENLAVHFNLLSQIPCEMINLKKLKNLALDGNPLTEFPPEIFQLANLQSLTLGMSRPILPRKKLQYPALLNKILIAELSSEILKLTNLIRLNLANIGLLRLPSEICQLTSLRTLDLSGNQLAQLPPEIGQLTGLKKLYADENLRLLTPPPEIVLRGTEAILKFLLEIHKHSVIRYELKLLIVGEGGTGKSSLLRSLREEDFEPNLTTTHGIEINKLLLPHPKHSEIQIILNTWDFGGQQIYHATHQFFLTTRSLYLIVWNSRLGVEQGRLHYWLDTIKALAPDAPVLLISTHIDERAPDLNYQLYKEAYPQLVGNLSVSNKDQLGLQELRNALAFFATRIHLKGQPWPRNWLDAEQKLLTRSEHHIDAHTYSECCEINGIDADIAKGTLGDYLHDLGKILYFRDDYILSHMVVLKPNWVTKAISYVLEDEETREAKGILLHSELPRIWAKDENGNQYEPHLYPVFLRLMERFDLSYQIEADTPGEHPEKTLIPQLLPHQPPLNLTPWPKVPEPSQVQVEMTYRFDFIPAGIMSWFIVRTHRYTQNLHWRDGVILAYQNHRARVELNPVLRELKLVVWGIQPYNFFTILKHTLDLILGRFEGLRIRREVPCNCHWETLGTESCREVYRYEEDLVKRMEAGKQTIECPASYKNVSVPKLLYGIHISTDSQVIADIKDGQKEVLQMLETLQKTDQRLLQKLDQQSELIVRNFTRQWNLEMQKFEAECPNTFYLVPSKNKPFNPKNWISHDYRLFLLCQHPSGPHCVGEGYELRKAADWWVTIAPWLRTLITFFKFGIPMGHAIGAVVDAVDVGQLDAQINLLEKITEDLPTIPSLDSISQIQLFSSYSGQGEAIGPALRALYMLLSQIDKSNNWGGLDRTLTPDGNILWLCDTHRQQYEAKRLELN